MSMQQIMRWQHDCLRMRGGMFNLDPLGKIHVSKEKTQKCIHIPSCIHVFIFPHVLESGGTFFIIHPSRFQFFPHGACPVHQLALTETLWSILIILYIPFYSCVLCIRPTCRTMFCSGLIACCYHPQPCKGSGSPLFVERMSNKYHSIL